MTDLSRRLLVLVLVALAAACSDGGDDAVEETSRPSVEETTATTEAAATTTATPITEAPRPVVGDTQPTPAGNTATVYEFQNPAVPNREMVLEPDPGFQFAAVDFEFCAAATFDPQGLAIFESDITLRGQDNRTYQPWNVQDHALQPRWSNDDPVAGECQRGWITYQVPSDVPILTVRWDTTGGGSGPFLDWSTT